MWMVQPIIVICLGFIVYLAVSFQLWRDSIVSWLVSIFSLLVSCLSIGRLRLLGMFRACISSSLARFSPSALSSGTSLWSIDRCRLRRASTWLLLSISSSRAFSFFVTYCHHAHIRVILSNSYRLFLIDLIDFILKLFYEIDVHIWHFLFLFVPFEIFLFDLDIQWLVL